MGEVTSVDFRNSIPIAGKNQHPFTLRDLKCVPKMLDRAYQTVFNYLCILKLPNCSNILLKFLIL
jgi:hypothetical protein